MVATGAVWEAGGAGEASGAADLGQWRVAVAGGESIFQTLLVTACSQMTKNPSRRSKRRHVLVQISKARSPTVADRGTHAKMPRPANPLFSLLDSALHVLIMHPCCSATCSFPSAFRKNRFAFAPHHSLSITKISS